MGEAEAEIQLMIQDEALSVLGIGLVETKQLNLRDDRRDRFLDGPACRRLGVVDFEPRTGAALPAPVRFTPYPHVGNPARGRYLTDGVAHDDPAFLAVNAFGTAFETIRMFEEPGGLGRQVDWAFDGEQLLVVPRAGEMANAYYERATRSIQFFSFDAAEGRRVHTALSRDIVAHECGHALLDAVVPSLFDSLTPQSLAIHEAVADLVAVLMALRSEKLRTAALAASDNSIRDARMFSSIAERFGAARGTGDRPPQALRDLLNDNTVAEVGLEPHRLSTVLSALFYERFLATYDALREPPGPDGPAEPPPGQSSTRGAGWALGSAAVIFRRLLLRGIDYLPPGELTFADVGRATIAADLAGDPEPTAEREAARAAFASSFRSRGIVLDVDELSAAKPRELDVTPDELADLRDSDWAAYRFVERHRDILKIPAHTPFVILARVDAIKEIGVKAAGAPRYPLQRELIMKISWDVLEDNGAAVVPARRRRLRTGATLAWRWQDGRLLALVHSDVTRAEQRDARDRALTNLVLAGAVAVADREGSPTTPGLRPREATPDRDHRPVAQVRLYGDIVRVTGTQRLLHIDGVA